MVNKKLESYMFTISYYIVEIKKELIFLYVMLQLYFALFARKSHFARTH